MADHQTKCPGCGAALLVSVLPHVGGSVEENVNVELDPNPPVDPVVPETETPVEEPVNPSPVPEPEPEPEAPTPEPEVTPAEEVALA